VPESVPERDKSHVNAENLRCLRNRLVKRGAFYVITLSKSNNELMKLLLRT